MLRLDRFHNTVLAANTIIGRVGNEGIAWSTPEKRYEVEAEARLIRAWAYRHLSYMWGKVPLVLTETTGETFRNRNGDYRNYRAAGEHTVNLTLTMA